MTQIVEIFHDIMLKNLFVYMVTHTNVDVGTNLATDIITMNTIIFLTDKTLTKRVSVVRMSAKGAHL